MCRFWVPHLYREPFLRAFPKFWRATVIFVKSVCPSIRMEQLGSHWTDFYEMWYMSFFSKMCRKNSSATGLTGTLREDVFTFMTISRSVLLRMRNVLNKSCRENQNTHFMFSIFFSENRAVYEIMSKNMVEPERPQTVWRMRVACWMK
jgi:hypothetical protein